MRRYLHFEFSELSMMSNALFHMIYMNQIYKLELLGDKGYEQLDRLAMSMSPGGGLLAGLASMGNDSSSPPDKSKKTVKRLVRANGK